MRTGEVITGAHLLDAIPEFQRFIDGLVHPVPDAASDGGIALLHRLHVLLEISYGITHGMGILTEEHRLILSTGVLGHPVHRGVHLAVEVTVGVASETLAVACPLIMDGTGAVHAVCHLIAVLEVAAASGFVAQAPHDDAGVVDVARHEPLDAVAEGRNPGCHVRDTLVGMVFEVSLIAAVESVVVEHGIHACIVGIVAGADGIDVVLLHEQDILQHGSHRHGTACLRVGVVPVRTLEHDTPSVDVEQRTAYLHLTYAHLGGEGHLIAAVGIALHHMERVEVGKFCRPE